MNEIILIVVNSLKLGGGAERIAVELGSNLEERNYDVQFLSRYEVKQAYKWEGKYEHLYEAQDKNLFRKIFREINTSKKIAKICHERDIEYVISFLSVPNLSSILSKILFRNKAKIIVSVRNNPLEKNSKTLKFLKKKLYPKADSVVVQTRRIEKILNKNFSIKNTSTIPNMVNLRKYKELAEEDIKEKHKDVFDNSFVFITVGSLRHQKGQWKLIRCFKEVNNKIENCKLVLLGDGPLKNKLENLTKRMDIEDEVFLLGKVENVFPYLKKSDCFTLTSLYEGFPNVLTEALSQNLPVISTDCVSGPREIVCPELEFNEDIRYPYYGQYGILAETFLDGMFFKTLEEKPLSKREKIFAETMIELMNDKELIKRYSYGLERVEDFKKEKIIEEWCKLIK